MSSLGGLAPESDPELERVLSDARERRSQRIGARERRFGIAAALSFAVVAIAMPLLLPSGRPFHSALAIGLVAAYAVADRVAFRVGSGWAVATQIVFVPMLFLLPPPIVPVVVAFAIAVDRIPELNAEEIHPTRIVLMLADGWYAVGPALVLSLAGAVDPTWADWPVYLAALASQFALDSLRTAMGSAMGAGSVRTALAEARSIQVVDFLLAPLGLVIAMACSGQPWTFLAALPILALLRIFAKEREARIDNALLLSRAYQGTAHLMAELLTGADEYTGGHSRNVVALATAVAGRLELNEREVREVELGALLHDIGKVSIPGDMIRKPGSLTDEEWAVMQTHTIEGEKMLGEFGGLLGEVGVVVRSHHERFDGAGYPDGLSAEEIPIAARIIAVCDAFHAMTSDRPYREAMGIPTALAELEREAGAQFDPEVVSALVVMVEAREARRFRHPIPGIDVDLAERQLLSPRS
jgi:putative nucleotidyltransferase with HDIG domain